MGKDDIEMVREGLMMFMAAMVGLYFMFATFFCVKNELTRTESVSLEMYRPTFDDGN